MIIITCWLRLQALISSAPVMVFMKGTPEVSFAQKAKISGNVVLSFKFWVAKKLCLVIKWGQTFANKKTKKTIIIVFLHRGQSVASVGRYVTS